MLFATIDVIVLFIMTLLFHYIYIYLLVIDGTRMTYTLVR